MLLCGYLAIGTGRSKGIQIFETRSDKFALFFRVSRGRGLRSRGEGRIRERLLYLAVNLKNREYEYKSFTCCIVATNPYNQQRIVNHAELFSSTCAPFFWGFGMCIYAPTPHPAVKRTKCVFELGFPQNHVWWLHVEVVCFFDSLWSAFDSVKS